MSTAPPAVRETTHAVASALATAATPVPPGPGEAARERPRTDLLASLSPSRAMDFKACPQLYRYRVVDRLPEPINPSALRGTLVHSVLERLFDLPAHDRTPAGAAALLPQAWADLLAPEQAVGELTAVDETAWLAAAGELLDTYFALEDPRRYEPTGRELAVEVELADGLVLRGIIDRVDESADGRLRVVDYKTGRSPAPDWESRAMFQLRFYALVVWRRTGVLPAVLRLMYLGDGVILEHTPDEDDLLATERQLTALQAAIRAAHESGRFEASPGRRCGWCSFAGRCPSARPAVGGAAAPQLPAAGPAEAVA